MITVTRHDEPDGDDLRRIDDGIGEANDAAAPLHEVRPLACFARGDDGRVIGGAVGRRWGRCAELQQLWVEPRHRGQRIGSRLLQEFEALATGHGCSHLFLETFSFQAPDFYAHHGWQQAHALDAYPHGIVRFLMVKTLGEPDRN